MVFLWFSFLHLVFEPSGIYLIVRYEVLISHYFFPGQMKFKCHFFHLPFTRASLAQVRFVSYKFLSLPTRTWSTISRGTLFNCLQFADGPNGAGPHWKLDWGFICSLHLPPPSFSVRSLKHCLPMSWGIDWQGKLMSN